MLVSIIVPVYNTEKYIEKCIDSLISQTHKDIEIILVDDGSTDRSGIICEQYQHKDSRISVIHTENHGVVSARNAGVKAAKGKYLGFVDSDDWVEKDMFDILLSEILYSNADISMCGHYVYQGQQSYIEPHGIESGVYSGNSKEIRNNVIYMGDSSTRGISLSLWDKLFRRDFFVQNQKLIPNTIKYSEDEICVSCCLLDSKKTVIVDTPLYHYRKHDNSICTSKNERYFGDISNTFYIWKQLISKYSDAEYILNKINKYYLENIARGINDLYGFGYGLIFPTYIPPYEMLAAKEVKKIILYGAGFVGKNYYKSIVNTMAVEVVAWVDKKYDNLDLILSLNYDAILIAVEYENVAEEIKLDLHVNYNIAEDKIVFRKPRKWIDTCKREGDYGHEMD